MARFERHYPGVLWQPARWRTRDGYMPFTVFHVYETEIATHEAYARVEQVCAIRFANGAARTEHGDLTEEYRGELVAARLLAPESA
jgi:hypothetical protein